MTGIDIFSIIHHMPFYDYKCRDCSKVFEIEKGMNENYLPECPVCGSANTSRIFSRIGRMAGKSADLDHEGSEQGGSCSSCTSGVCSSCSAKG